MYEHPEIMRQLVNDRLDEGRGRAANRRLAGEAPRRARRRLRTRLANLFTTGRAPAPVAQHARA
jgi:hypothetical protein